MFHFNPTRAMGMTAAAALAVGGMICPAAADDHSQTQVCPTTPAAASPVVRSEAHRYGDERVRKVNLADLDLSTAAGSNTARERIHEVARRLCGQVESSLDLSRQSNFVACVESAMETASRQLARPALAATRDAETSRAGQP